MTKTELELDAARKNELIRDLAFDRFHKLNSWFTPVRGESWADKAKRTGMPYEIVQLIGEHIDLLRELMTDHD